MLPFTCIEPSYEIDSPIFKVTIIHTTAWEYLLLLHKQSKTVYSILFYHLKVTHNKCNSLLFKLETKTLCLIFCLTSIC